MTSPNASSAISLRGIGKRFGDVTALHDVSFEIADNEFFTLLGPSGCGKTTLLRMIAGFEATSAGEIFLYGQEIENLPPDRRPVNTVFQSYALFPHMNVAENIGFGLRMLKWKSDAIEQRVNEMIALVKLDQFAARNPSQLSGGQQQRVALARAMAPRPKVLLLDEPLSALDLKLRQAMRSELKQLQKETGITFVFVTHDQEEALSMSDRIAVMSEGEVQQIGTPTDIYESPSNRFVADFVGETNFIEATILDLPVNSNRATCRLLNGDTIDVDNANKAPMGCEGVVSIRPERLVVTATTSSEEYDGFITGTLADTVYLGTDRQLKVDIGNGRSLVARSQNSSNKLDVSPGDAVQVRYDTSAAVFLAN